MSGASKINEPSPSADVITRHIRQIFDSSIEFSFSFSGAKYLSVFTIMMVLSSSDTFPMRAILRHPLFMRNAIQDVIIVLDGV